METAFSSLAEGRFTPGQRDAIVAPRVHGTRQVAVYLNGANGTASEAVGGDGLPAVGGLNWRLARDGLLVVAPTVTQTWGNATAMSRIDQAVTYARANLGGSAAPPVMVGGSHGATGGLLYAASHEVAAVVGFIPAVDVAFIRDNDLLGQRATIDAAWGVTHPQALPADAIVLGKDPGCPVQLWYSTDDPISTGVVDYATSVNADLHSLGALGHTDAAIAAIDTDQMLAFIAAHT